MVDLVFQGGTIKLLVDLLNINKAEDEQKALLEELTDSVIGVEHFLMGRTLASVNATEIFLSRTSCLE